MFLTWQTQQPFILLEFNGQSPLRSGSNDPAGQGVGDGGGVGLGLGSGVGLGVAVPQALTIVSGQASPKSSHQVSMNESIEQLPLGFGRRSGLSTPSPFASAVVKTVLVKVTVGTRAA